ncbi:MAG TPA: DNA polymerase III subunit gamma/tau [Candidatus Binataceae bacterium]|nr:DNA polymerase III subunit gamma/tau [Candidatus Binataceae bacterium]
MAEASSHLVLARKWRPDRFGELVGQEHVTRTLTEAMKRGRIAHAFLFTGIRGVGKTTAARILARCLNCERGPTPEPCGECAACIEIRAGRALDVSEIDGATYRKIDDARAIIENLSYRPARDRFKIYIIDEAHQLTDQAFNALLKTLEEPPPHVKFILATTEPQKMPETILSRLQRYDFRRIALQVIFARLKELASREGVNVEESALLLIAREAGGSMRDAERMLETSIACASSDVVTEAEVASTLGVASRTVVYALCDAILHKDAASALRKVRELHSRGANLESLGRDLLEALRNLAVAKLPSNDSMTPLTDLPDHEASDLKRLADSASNRDIMRLFRLMAEAQEELLKSPYPDLLMEMAVVRMASLAPVMDADELLRAIGNGGGSPSSSSSSGGAASSGASGSVPTRRMKVEGEVNATAPVRAPSPPPPAPARATAPLGAGIAQQSTSRDLPELRDFIRARRAALAGFMEQGASLAFADDVLSVNARNDIYIRYLSDNRATIAELASEFFARPVKVEVSSNGTVVAAATGKAPSSASSSGEAPKISAPEVPRVETAPPPEVEPKLTVVRDAAPTSIETAPKPRAGTPEDRQAVLQDPEMRRIFDELEARLVEVRITPDTEAAKDAASRKE